MSLGGGARAALVIALATGARPAAAFLRSTTCAGDPQAGYALWWGGAPPAVTLHLSSAHVPSGCADYPTTSALVGRSLATWNAATLAGAGQPCTDFAFALGPATSSFLVGASDGRNVIAFRRGSCADLAPPGDDCLTAGGCGNVYDCWEADRSHGGGVLAITWISFDTGSGRILDADTELDDWDGVSTGPSSGYLYTCAPPGSPACNGNTDPRALSPGCVYIDVGSVVLHESGHVLGLGHPCDGPSQCSPPSIMAPTIMPGATRRALEADDVGGICTIYPASQATSRLKLPGSCGNEARGCGCGGGPASSLWALLPPLLLRRRRRG